MGYQNIDNHGELIDNLGYMGLGILVGVPLHGVGIDPEGEGFDSGGAVALSFSFVVPPQPMDTSISRVAALSTVICGKMYRAFNGYHGVQYCQQ